MTSTHLLNALSGLERKSNSAKRIHSLAKEMYRSRDREIELMLVSTRDHTHKSIACFEMLPWNLSGHVQ